MRKQLSTIFVALSLFLMLASVPIYAQEGDTIDVNIPFKFTIGNTTLRPGKYIIERADLIDANVWRIHDQDNSMSVDFLTNEAQTERTPTKTELVFNEVEGQHFLSQIWIEGENLGRELSPPQAEQRLEEMAAKHTRSVVAHCMKRHMKQAKY